MSADELLRVEQFSVWYPGQSRPALDGLDLSVAAGECVAVVGSSGSGKSTLCRALLDLLPPGSRMAGNVRWRGQPLVPASDRWRELRGGGMGLVLQDHRQALDPIRTVGAQLDEVCCHWRPTASTGERRGAMAELLGQVGLRVAHGQRYPHELSGGQRQRANLAITLAADPELLLADEPTTALDLPVQRSVLGLLVRQVRQRGCGLLLVTHDRDLVTLVADRIITVGAEPSVITTVTLPEFEVPAPARLVTSGLHVAMPAPTGRRDVLHDVSLTVASGEVLGVTGESGAGKTTLARALAGWIAPRAGTVTLEGARRGDRPRVQLIGQDPVAALDPQQRVAQAVAEAAAVEIPRERAAAEARRLLAAMDLPAALHERRPEELSGGQRQRVQFARALAARPWFLVADEPASSLDPVRRDALLALFLDMGLRYRVGLVLISHDLDLLAARAGRILVLHGGRVVEVYTPATQDPLHPFTASLRAAAPSRLVREDLLLEPAATTGGTSSAGCPYASVCPHALAACHTNLPPLLQEPDGRFLRCPVRHLEAR